ncbi:MAG: hypothetical protein IJM53_02500 [Lachnospiraceae bacterium]|nr:hypothetical protein [Lachnospiraceae bacterium]
MIIAINSVSAFEFWRNARCQLNADQYSFKNRDLVDLPLEYEFKMNNKLALFLTEQLKISPPLYVVAPRAGLRSECIETKCSTRPKHLPPRSFVEVPCPGLGPMHKVLVACPELCFVQLAPQLHFEELVYLGFELCGTYVFDKFAAAGQLRREQIATADSIRDYVSQAHDMKGLIKARQAARYLIDNSNSPMESKIVTNAVLPFFRGGYAVPFPVLNERAQLTVKGEKALRQDEVVPDALWRRQRVTLEYDSDLTHLSSEQHDRDQNRSNAVTASDFKGISFTRADFKNPENSYMAFTTLRGVLGMRDEEATLRKYADKRKEVFQRLFGQKQSGIFRV